MAHYLIGFVLQDTASRESASVKPGKAQSEQITSGFPATADIARTSANGRLVPKGDIIFRSFAAALLATADEMIE
jgi:hypothetical protein